MRAEVLEYAGNLFASRQLRTKKIFFTLTKSSLPAKTLRGAQHLQDQISFRCVERSYVFERELEDPKQDALVAAGDVAALEKPSDDTQYGKMRFCKVRYPSVLSSVDQMNANSGTHWSQMFGSFSTMLELLFKKRNLKGAQWLRIVPQTKARQNETDGAWPRREAQTFCDFEVQLNSQKQIISETDWIQKKKKLEEKYANQLSFGDMDFKAREKNPPPVVFCVVGMKTLQFTAGGEHMPILASCCTLTQSGVADKHKSPQYFVDTPAAAEEFIPHLKKFCVMRKMDIHSKKSIKEMVDMDMVGDVQVKLAENERGLLKELIM